jgi:AraC-like DNA-binding protein
MALNINGFNSLILFGVIQGLIFATVIARKKEHPGSIFLAGFFLILAWNGLETCIWSMGISLPFRLFDLLAYVPVFGLGPCLYLYLKKLFIPYTPITKKQILSHFALPGWQLFAQITIYSFYLLTVNKVINLNLNTSQLYHFYLAYSEPLSAATFVGYLIASFALLFDYRKSSAAPGFLKENFRITFRWSSAILYAISVLSIIWILTIVAGFWYEGDSHYYVVELALVFVIYWIGFIGYHKIQLILRKAPKSIPPSSEVQQAYLKQLIHAMDSDRKYLDPELNQTKLSIATGVPIKLISTTLNQVGQTNFNNFVNAYRIEEVKKRLKDGKANHLTISAIALECGFNSHATFQRAFKLHTGTTPSEYLSTTQKDR